MFKYFIQCSILLLFNQSIIAQEQDIIQVSENLKIIAINDHTFIHESYSASEEVKGGFWSNGMILVDNAKAFLFDTPMVDSTTAKLLDYIENDMRLKITGFICNDWHGDSMEGLELILEKDIPAYAHEMTKEICKEKGLPIPTYGFQEKTSIAFESYEIIASYHGAAHTMDNIVVFIPKENILFADCMIKAAKWKNLGYTGDGDLSTYAETVRKVKETYPEAKIVIPGHDEYGGMELLDHTLELAKSQTK